MMWPLVNSKFSYFDWVWEEHRLSVVRHLTILLFVDWLPTGQWFAKSPFSLRAGIYFSPIARSKMAESCTYLPSVLPIALFHQPSGCSSNCCHYGVQATIHFLHPVYESAEAVYYAGDFNAEICGSPWDQWIFLPVHLCLLLCNVPGHHAPDEAWKLSCSCHGGYICRLSIPLQLCNLLFYSLRALVGIGNSRRVKIGGT